MFSIEQYKINNVVKYNIEFRHNIIVPIYVWLHMYNLYYLFVILSTKINVPFSICIFLINGTNKIIK